jgi:hypothetical protein
MNSPPWLQLSPEGAVLEGGEKAVVIGERSAMVGAELLDRSPASGEVAL